MDENWLAQELAKLGVEDEQTMVPYVLGILQGEDGVEQALESIQPFCNSADSEAFQRFATALTLAWQKVQQQEKEDEPAPVGLPPVTVVEKPLVVKSSTNSTEQLQRQEDKEATLRMARRIAEKEMEAFQLASQEAAAASSASTSATTGDLGNRAAVQQKLVQAQREREDLAKAKLAQSKSAEAANRKDKEQKKLERQKRAQKGERRA